jgi:pilus assembly protein CpaF
MSTSQSEMSSPDLAERIQIRMMQEFENRQLDFSDPVGVRQLIEEVFDAILKEEGIAVTRARRDQIYKEVVAEILGLGPLEILLADDFTTDIMVVGPERVYVERKGHIERTSITFEDNDHIKRILDRILAPLGRRVDEESPTVDARLSDGSRVNAVVPPIALDGPILTIRKFAADPLTDKDLIANGTASEKVFEFLRGAVHANANILVSGGSSSGKTTLLNVLSAFIPHNERLVTIENAAELQLQQPHVVRLESRPPNLEGHGEISIRLLVINSLRMRPDRIIVGEVRSAEAIDLLQAMNTGHEGSMGTIHANSPRDALSRLETMILMGGVELPLSAIREQMASAINFVVQMIRLRSGERKIVSISEIEDIEVDTISITEIFRWERAPHLPGGGDMIPTGVVPRFMDRIDQAGYQLPQDIYTPPDWAKSN